VELAEAMAEVRALARDYADARTDLHCPPHLRRLGEDSLDAAAERLDKAMVAWINDYSQTTVLDGRNLINPTAARPQE
jgi:hypothetical protein